MPEAGSSDLRDDRGAGGALALMVVLVVIAVCGSLLTIGGAVVVQTRANGAADSAALAAAAAVAGFVSTEPCEAARQVLEANGMRLQTCEVDGTAVTVGCETQAAGIRIVAISRAGQPIGG